MGLALCLVHFRSEATAYLPNDLIVVLETLFLHFFLKLEYIYKKEARKTKNKNNELIACINLLAPKVPI